ncbi:hypothetical protein TNIN_470261 [Trichonephila inaurata madagascariensis]|uniref:Uncharacterized protein n=1 Tax=Trichonephila inaurata madagascariensis TaxID=2747483 RepID=A0A8X6XR50_9ARAC|nr:hypothetical protein TNIN_470261 [Trichonephila inaurata madagascariensis]
MFNPLPEDKTRNALLFKAPRMVLAAVELEEWEKWLDYLIYLWCPLNNSFKTDTQPFNKILHVRPQKIHHPTTKLCTVTMEAIFLEYRTC